MKKLDYFFQKKKNPIVIINSIKILQGLCFCSPATWYKMTQFWSVTRGLGTSGLAYGNITLLFFSRSATSSHGGATLQAELSLVLRISKCTTTTRQRNKHRTWTWAAAGLDVDSCHKGRQIFIFFPLCSLHLVGSLAVVEEWVSKTMESGEQKVQTWRWLWYGHTRLHTHTHHCNDTLDDQSCLHGIFFFPHPLWAANSDSSDFGPFFFQSRTAGRVT